MGTNYQRSYKETSSQCKGIFSVYFCMADGYALFFPNAVLILANRLRRWPNIETALGNECLTKLFYFSHSAV